MDISRRVVVLDRGRVIAEGDPQSVQASPEVITAYLGTRRPQERAA
jgi:branched-chain amino acid transport system ATP-binding protein